MWWTNYEPTVVLQVACDKTNLGGELDSLVEAEVFLSSWTQSTIDDAIIIINK